VARHPSFNQDERLPFVNKVGELGAGNGPLLCGSSAVRPEDAGRTVQPPAVADFPAVVSIKVVSHGNDYRASTTLTDTTIVPHTRQEVKRLFG